MPKQPFPWRVRIAEDAAAVGLDHESRLMLRPFFFLVTGNDGDANYVSPEIWVTRSDAETALADLPPEFNPIAEGWEPAQPLHRPEDWGGDDEYTLAVPGATAA